MTSLLRIREWEWPNSGWERTLVSLIFIFGIAVFIWKPGMYLLSLAFGLYFLARFSADEAYRLRALRSPVVLHSVALFFFGVLSAAVAMQQTEDLLWFVRKTLFLWLIPPLYLAFQDREYVRIGFLGTLAGFFIAVLITLVKNWGAFGADRITGTWPASMWDTLIGMYALFVVLHMAAVRSNTSMKPLLIAVATVSIVLVILAGGRATWIALALTASVFLVLHNRKALVWLVSSCFLAAAATYSLTDQKFSNLVDRAGSITDTQKNESNWLRLQLWNLTAQHLAYYAKNEPKKLLFGAGSETYLGEHKEFYQLANIGVSDRARLEVYGTPSGDPHNSYLDATARSGLIWLGALLTFLCYFARKISLGVSSNRPRFLLTYFLIVGFFYSLIPSFAMFFLVWFMLLVSRVTSFEESTT